MLRALGLKPARGLSVGGVLEALLSELAEEGDWWLPVVRRIVMSGSLAERMVRSAGTEPSRRRLRGIYGELADCLHHGELYGA
jgi:hypothetical protein